MVKSKKNLISNRGAFSSFSKNRTSSPRQFTVCEQLIFSKLLCEIEAAAICFVMERGRRKSQQNSRIRVRAEIKLVYPVWNLSDSSKSHDVRQIKGVWKCRWSCLLFTNLSGKDRSDSASRVQLIQYRIKTSTLVQGTIKKLFKRIISFQRS